MNELTISLKQGDKVPLYEQIYSYIKEEIQKGAIPSGEKLPSTRALCRHLDVSRSTVELAYEQLVILKRSLTGDILYLRSRGCISSVRRAGQKKRRRGRKKSSISMILLRMGWT